MLPSRSTESMFNTVLYGQVVLWVVSLFFFSLGPGYRYPDPTYYLYCS